MSNTDIVNVVNNNPANLVPSQPDAKTLAQFDTRQAVSMDTIARASVFHRELKIEVTLDKAKTRLDEALSSVRTLEKKQKDIVRQACVDATDIRARELIAAFQPVLELAGYRTPKATGSNHHTHRVTLKGGDVRIEHYAVFSLTAEPAYEKDGPNLLSNWSMSAQAPVDIDGIEEYQEIGKRIDQLQAFIADTETQISVLNKGLEGIKKEVRIREAKGALATVEAMEGGKELLEGMNGATNTFVDNALEIEIPDLPLLEGPKSDS